MKSKIELKKAISEHYLKNQRAQSINQDLNISADKLLILFELLIKIDQQTKREFNQKYD